MKARWIPRGSLVYDKEAARRLYQDFYGNPLGLRKVPRNFPFSTPLLLDIYETTYLVSKGILEVYKGNKKLSLDELKRSYILNEAIYRAYKALRDRGYIVRPGTKYGAHFLVYREGPDKEHAPYAVIVTENISGLDLVRVSRLSHSVRKFAVLALVGSDVKFYRVRWFKTI